MANHHGYQRGYDLRRDSASGLYVPPKESIRLADGFAGPSLVGNDLTLNGTTVPALARYIGDGADATEWVALVGTDLPFLEGGAALSFVGAPVTDGSSAVKFGEGDLYQAAAAATLDLTTEDIVIRGAIKLPAGISTSLVFGKLALVGLKGWEFATDHASARLLFRIGSLAAANVDVFSASSLALDAWHTFFVAVDRDKVGITGGQMYINGPASGTGVDFTTVADTASSPAKFTLGGRDPAVGGQKSGATLLALDVFMQDAWLDGQTDVAAAALTYHRQMRGLIAQLAKGDNEPTVDSRTTAAYVERIESGGERKLYQVGANWGNVHEHPPGQTRAMIRIEPARTVAAAQSEDMSAGTQWGNSTVTTNAVVAPNGTLTADRLVETTNPNAHGRYNGGLALAAGERVISSIFTKDGDRRYAVSGCLEPGTGHVGYVIVDLTTGAILKNAITGNFVFISAGIEDKGGGQFRIYSVYTYTGGGFPRGMCAISDDGDRTAFVGDPATFPLGITFWGMQVENISAGNGSEHPGSYIPSTSGVVIRTADSLRIEGLQNLGIDGSAKRGRMHCFVWLPNVSLGTDRYAWSLNDGGVVTDRIEVFVRASDNLAVVQIESTEFGSQEISIAGITALNDGEIHKLEVVWGNGRVQLFVDGVLEAQSLVTQIPDGLDRIEVGASYTGICLGAAYIADLHGGPF